MTEAVQTSSLLGGRKIVFPVLTAILFLAVVELLSFCVALAVKRDLFSGESDYFASIDAAGFNSWKQSPWFDAELGWNVPQGVSSHHEKNCLGQEVAYSFALGHRLDAGSAEAPTVALFGDSYTYGQEVADSETISSALWRNHHIAALNYGAPGYSPEQAVLKFERLARQNKLPPIAVLLIMHENIRRTTNSLRAVYTSGTDVRFGIKPYMANGVLQPLEYPETYDEYVKEAKRRFQTDYWARPDFSAPFSLSLARAGFIEGQWFMQFGSQPFSYEYTTDNELRRNLAAVISRFRQSAKDSGIRPIVVLIPQNQRTYQVSADFAASVGILEFTDPGMDWGRYNLKPDGNCHPSSYGTERIAKFINSALER